MTSCPTEKGEAENRSELPILVGLTACSLAWASAFLAGKVALAEMAPLSVAAWRQLIAGLVLLPFALRALPSRRVLREVALPLGVLVLCGGILYPVVFMTALERTSSINASLLVALNPVGMVLLAPLVGERIDRNRLLGVGLALLGAAVVITEGDLARVAALDLNDGDLFGLLAAAVWCGFGLTARHVVHRLPPHVMNGAIFTTGGVVLLVFVSARGSLEPLGSAPGSALLGVLSMAVLSSALSGQIFLTGVRRIGIGRASVFIYLVPVLSAVLATTFLGEPFGAAHLVGGTAVLLGVACCNRVSAAAPRASALRTPLPRPTSP